MTTELKCVCGKMCSSQPGLTLHQKNCEEAVAAKESGQSTILTEDGKPVTFESAVQKIVDLVNEMAQDADRCLKEKNKSAGRRARKSLNELRKMCPELRKILLDTTR